MTRRRTSVPSPLILTPSTVPLRRGQPKFVIPTPPSSQAVYMSSDHRLKRSDSSQVVALKPLPKLIFAPSSSSSPLASYCASVNTSPVESEYGSRQRSGSEVSSDDASTTSMTSRSRSSSSTSISSMQGSATWSSTSTFIKPWTGPDAMLPQIAQW